MPRLTSSPIALLAGVLDAGGNVLYMLARQHVRLDIAAVLSSLYPVATVALASIISREAVTRSQWMGAGACLLAVLLITA
jgi:drug/metabolite transporter (DMT)-like permease